MFGNSVTSFAGTRLLTFRKYRKRAWSLLAFKENASMTSGSLLLILPRSRFFWTLFGPYPSARMGPRGTGRLRRINALHDGKPLATSANALEVLAGAISWGFKSLSAPK